MFFLTLSVYMLQLLPDIMEYQVCMSSASTKQQTAPHVDTETFKFIYIHSISVTVSLYPTDVHLQAVCLGNHSSAFHIHITHFTAMLSTCSIW